MRFLINLLQCVLSSLFHPPPPDQSHLRRQVDAEDVLGKSCAAAGVQQIMIFVKEAKSLDDDTSNNSVNKGCALNCKRSKKN